jgi:hypothetical protein
MKKNLFILSALSTLFFTSCVTTNQGFQSSPVIARNVDIDPIKADVKVDEKSKRTGESTSAYFLIFRVSGDKTYTEGIRYSSETSFGLLDKLNPIKIIQSSRLNKVRGAAAYKAIENTNYDLLVHPNYTTTVKNYLIYKEYNVKVDGYGAKYQNFRTEKQKITTIQDGKEIILQDK